MTHDSVPVAHVDDLREAAAELLDDHGLRVGLGDAAPLALLGLRQHALAARLHHVGGDEAERLPDDGEGINFDDYTGWRFRVELRKLDYSLGCSGGFITR